MTKPGCSNQHLATTRCYSYRSMDSPIIAHNDREYHLFLLRRSKKSAIEIFNKPRAAIEEMMDWKKDIFSKAIRSSLDSTLL